MDAVDVAVIGGGAIGLSIAWRAASRGLAVTLLDGEPARAASRVAAGMLAPITEVHYGEEPLLSLNLAAAAAYPRFVAELEEAAGSTVGHRPCGTISIALDADDDAALDDLHSFQLRLGLPVQRLTGRECREREPMLAPAIRSGVLAEADHQVDNRLLLGALDVAATRAGVSRIAQDARAITVEQGRATGVLLTNGRRLAAATVVLAAGCWSSALGEGLPPGTLPAVRPVKGQLLVLRGPAHPALLGGNVRGLARGHSIYLVPRADGRIIAGATMEERGFDTRPTVDAARTLLRDAHALVPGVDELELVEHAVGLRPGSPDNAPLVGPTPLEGLLAATGHHRNGILLAPLTADAIVEMLIRGAAPELLTPFTPARLPAGARA